MSRELSIRIGSVALGPVEFYAFLQALEFFPQRLMPEAYLRQVFDVKQITAEKVALIKFASWQHLSVGVALCFADNGPRFLGLVRGGEAAQLTAVLLVNAVAVVDATQAVKAPKDRWT